MGAICCCTSSVFNSTLVVWHTSYMSNLVSLHIIIVELQRKTMWRMSSTRNLNSVTSSYSHHFQKLYRIVIAYLKFKVFCPNLTPDSVAMPP